MDTPRDTATLAQTHGGAQLSFAPAHFDPSLPHDSLGPQLNVIVWPLVFLSAIFLSLRVLSKFRQKRRLWWDDYMLILGWVVLVAQAVLGSYWVQLGLGSEIYDIPSQNFAKMPVVADMTNTLSLISNVLTKTSFAITLLRIPEKWMRICCWAVIISMNMATLTSVVFVWTCCIADQNPKGGEKCVPGNIVIAYDIFSGCYSGVMDITLALLPWKFIWKQQMKTKEKVAVGIAMSMGIFAGTAAFVKSSYIPTLAEGSLLAVIPLTAWNAGETAVTIIAASIPVLRALLKQSRQNQMPLGYMSESGVSNLATFGSSRARTTFMMSRTARKMSHEMGSNKADMMGSPAGEFQYDRNSMKDEEFDGNPSHRFNFGWSGN